MPGDALDGARGARPALFALVIAVVALAGAPARAERAHDTCAEAAQRMEHARGIPRGLVQAVALAESGRWLDDLGRTRAWPWTVTSGPDSYYLPSKEAALRKVRELQAQGRTNIDVGCMQVNLGWHGDAFDSLEEAMEPSTNVAYGAQFLKDLRLRTRSWARATAHYHSRHPERGEAYRTRVYHLWQRVRRGLIETGRGTRVAASASILRGAASSSPGARAIRPGFEPGPRPGGIAVVRGR